MECLQVGLINLKTNILKRLIGFFNVQNLDF